VYFEDVRQWQGTAEGLAKELERQVRQFGLSVEPPALRTIRLWRSKQLLSQPKGYQFGFRQILEGLAIALLLKKGWTLAAIAQVLPSFPDTALERQIVAEADGQDPTWLPTIQTTYLSLPPGHRQASDLAEDAIV
jgi:DNA-binding transcriptional MerR regulator